jgi:hypothetical protein
MAFAATRNVPGTQKVLDFIGTALDAASFLFVAADFGPNEGGTGKTDKWSTTMRIDVGRITSGNYNTNVAAVMIHEFGHAVYNISMGGRLQYRSDVSGDWAISFENAYRRSVGWELVGPHP